MLYVVVGLAMLVSGAFRAWTWWKRRREPQPPDARPLRRLPRDPVLLKRRIAVWLMVGIGLGGAIGWVALEGSSNVTAKIYQREIAGAFASFMKFLLIGVCGLFVLLLVLMFLVRDPAIKQAAKLALNKQYDQAERVLQDRISAKGANFDRLKALGAIYAAKERWNESLRCLEDAEKLRKPGSLANDRAVVLWKLGRLDEGLALLSEARRAHPNDFTVAANLCLLAAEAGQRDQALEALDAAEMIFRRYDRKYTKQWLGPLEECRQKLNLAHGFEVTRAE